MVESSRKKQPVISPYESHTLLTNELGISFPYEPVSESKQQALNLALQQELHHYIGYENPLLMEMYARSEYVNANESGVMTELIQKDQLDPYIYEQMLLAITITEGLTSWGTVEIQNHIESKSKNELYDSDSVHAAFIENGIKRYSILKNNKEVLLNIPLNAADQFPSKFGTTKNYMDFFGLHALFCATKSLIGHASVNDILQPLLKDHTTDQALQLFIQNPPNSLEELNNPSSQYDRLSKI